VEKSTAAKTFPVGIEFAGIQAATARTTNSLPKDLGYVVAVVEDIFVQDKRGSEIMRWNAER
jgi:hypothetical protein